MGYLIIDQIFCTMAWYGTRRICDSYMRRFGRSGNWPEYQESWHTQRTFRDTLPIRWGNTWRLFNNIILRKTSVTRYAEKWSPETLSPEEWSPEIGLRKMVPGKIGPREIGPRKNVLLKLFSVKRMLENLDDFLNFYRLIPLHTQKDVWRSHAPNCRTLKEFRKVYYRVLGFHRLITSEHFTYTPQCSTLTPRFLVSEFWVCCRVLGFHRLITSQHYTHTHTPRCSTLSPRFFFWFFRHHFSEDHFSGDHFSEDQFSGDHFSENHFSGMPVKLNI